MKKYIEMTEEALAKVKQARRLEGVLQYDAHTGKLTFKHYNRKACKYSRYSVIGRYSNGSLMESDLHYKFYSIVDKTKGVLKASKIIKREADLAALDLVELKDNNL